HLLGALGGVGGGGLLLLHQPLQVIDALERLGLLAGQLLLGEHALRQAVFGVGYLGAEVADLLREFVGMGAGGVEVGADGLGGAQALPQVGAGAGELAAEVVAVALGGGEGGLGHFEAVGDFAGGAAA